VAPINNARSDELLFLFFVNAFLFTLYLFCVIIFVD
jgi:hypothetical protein